MYIDHTIRILGTLNFYLSYSSVRTLIRPLLKGIYPRASSSGISNKKCPLPKCLCVRERRRKMKKRPREGDLFRPAGHVSDSNKRSRQRSVPRRARPNLGALRGPLGGQLFPRVAAVKSIEKQQDNSIWFIFMSTPAFNSCRSRVAFAGKAAPTRRPGPRFQSIRDVSKLHARARMRRRS